MRKLRRGHGNCRSSRRHPTKIDPRIKEKSEADLQKLITKEKAIKDTDQSNPI
ncbi:MAG: hypothetical protein ACLSTJ_07925 [Clostridium neonatale]